MVLAKQLTRAARSWHILTNWCVENIHHYVAFLLLDENNGESWRVEKRLLISKNFTSWTPASAIHHSAWYTRRWRRTEIRFRPTDGNLLKGGLLELTNYEEMQFSDFFHLAHREGPLVEENGKRKEKMNSIK